MRFLLATAVAALVLLPSVPSAARTLHARAPATSPDGHLYVAMDTAKPNTGFVLRYPLFAGIPAQKPDMRYNNATEPLAVGSDGTFYASVPFECCEAIQKLTTYAPNDNKPARHITLQYIQSDGTEALAMAVDANDYLYVAYAPLFSGARGLRAGSAPAVGVAVYAPTQHGDSPPVQAFQVRAVSSPSQVNAESMTFAPDGDLDVLVDDFPREILSFSDPLTNPQIARELVLPNNTEANGLTALSGGTDIYVLGTAPSGKVSEVDIYRGRAHGNAGPLRTFALPTFANGLSIRGGILYTILSAHSIGGFPSDASGSPPPLFTLNVPASDFPEAVATGP